VLFVNIYKLYFKLSKTYGILWAKLDIKIEAIPVIKGSTPPSPSIKESIPVNTLANPLFKEIKNLSSNKL
jgi:hypothetical protein